ncbi:MAG: ATPase, T2SS/T4P/T4SS family [Planctomycetota bacterium]
MPHSESTSDTAEQHGWAERLGLAVCPDLDAMEVDPRFVATIPIGHARRHQVVGVIQRDADADTGDTLTLAIATSAAWQQCDVLSRRIGVRIVPVVAPERSILALIDHAYAERTTNTQAFLSSADVRESVDRSEEATEDLIRLASREDLLDDESRSPIIRLVNQILFDAVVAGASDVHIQPYEDHLQVRQRIDGVLCDVVEIPKAIQEEVLTRIKVLGRMNVAEKRLPQDGRASVQLGPRVVDLRIASLPTSHNERIVVRLLDKSAQRYQLADMGMPNDVLRQWQDLIKLDHGLILVTGPTGSGKSTTLYAALQTLDAAQTNILTLEDPIEYQLRGISQTQINEKKGMTFASGMRSLLRQDPDVIMVGEIRDGETATMAIQASLTGHLVFSTLHTNDAASAVTRLLDLGVQPYLLASSLVASLAQRLVRTVCSNCAGTANQESAMPTCAACRGTGYRGRLGLFELLIVDESIRERIQSRASATDIRSLAQDAGMRLLREDGQSKIAQGLTTDSEVARVTRLSGDGAV